MPATWKMKPYRVGRACAGLGLFAARPIKKGTPIVSYKGRMLDCWKKEDDAVINKYLFEINSRWTIDGSPHENTARYINHSCKPNAEPDVFPRKRKVVIKALRDIAAGEEINYDYGEDYFDEYLKPHGCRCLACAKKLGKRKKRASK